MTVRPRFSLIVPAYNEQELLPRLLATVETARQAYRGRPEAIEVIVADNASSDATAQIARELGCRVVPISKRVIAAVRNAGAKAALGELLCFIDADSQIHPETFNAIDEAMASGELVGGVSGVRLERWSLGLAATYAVMVLVVTLMNIDAGVVFCRKMDWEAVGGYNEERLFAEDVEFLWDLKKLGKTRSQRLRRLTSVKAIASTRKFDQHGEWHYFTQIFRLAWLMLRSPSGTTEFARTYWYEPDR